MTVNAGLRYEWVNARVPAQTSPAGRFVPARSYAETPNVPNQHDPAPRFGLAYDLFGNGKTALKYSLNRYNASRTTGDANSGAQRYNPLARTSITLNWTDLNKDDIAQGELGCVYLTPGCEIDLSGLPSNFGFRALTTQDPNIKRTWDLEQGVEIQHELLPRDFGDGLVLSRHVPRHPAQRQPQHLAGELDALSGVQSDRRHADDDLRLHAGARRHDEAGRRHVRHDVACSTSRRSTASGSSSTPGCRRARRSLVDSDSTGCSQNTCAEPDNPNLLRFCNDANLEGNLPAGDAPARLQDSVPEERQAVGHAAAAVRRVS